MAWCGGHMGVTVCYTAICAYMASLGNIIQQAAEPDFLLHSALAASLPADKRALQPIRRT